MWPFLNSRSKRHAPHVPNGIRIYVVGDVHGRVDLLDQMFARIDSDLARRTPKRSIQILLGDFVDRGHASKEVIDRLIERGRTHEVVCLKGNHENCMIQFLRHPSTLSVWLQLGGAETLMSYGIRLSDYESGTAPIQIARDLAAVLPDSHRRFLESLRLNFVCGDFFFVHAGVRPRISLNQQSEDDMMWIRDDFLLYEEDFGKIIVHGHTPVREADFRPNRINIDTGAYATGKLTCLLIEHDEVFTL